MIFRQGFRQISCLIFLTSLTLAACQTTQTNTSMQGTGTPVETAASPTLTLAHTPTSTTLFIPTFTPSPTQQPTLFPLPTQAPDLALLPCNQRRPAADDLFQEVTASYGLDPNYVPPDLVRLGDYLPGKVTLPDMQLRLPAAQALGKMVKDMLATGLSPTVLSAYRSFFDQAVAHQRWLVDDPANANKVSALPGHSEHQLGTAVDFGSPEMPALTGSTTDPFSPVFASTSEGRWLAVHAFEYGFTMTSPQQAEALTGLAYEPWHYRYVGVGLATYLNSSGYFLSEFLLKAWPVMPCLP